MTNAQLVSWLQDRGVSEEAITGVIGAADQIKEIFRESAEIGAAVNHEDWLEEQTTIGRGSDMDKVVWFMIGMINAPISFIELSGE